MVPALDLTKLVHIFLVGFFIAVVHNKVSQ